MSYHCFKCGAEVSLASPSQVGRRDECPSCSTDLHACLNCKFYDQTAYNECHESQAERVLEKDRSNYCDYFVFGDGAKPGSGAGKDSAVKAADDLFK